MVAIHFPHGQVVDAGAEAFYKYKGNIQRFAAFLKCSIRWAVNCFLQSFTFVWVIHVGEMHHRQLSQPVSGVVLFGTFFGEHIRKNFCRCIISDFLRILLSVQFIQKKFRKICSFCQPQIRVEAPYPRLPCHMRCIARKNRVTGILKQAGFFHDSDFPALPVRVIIKTGKLREETLSRYDDEHQQCQTVPVEPPRVGCVQHFLNGRKKCIQIFRAGSSRSFRVDDTIVPLKIGRRIGRNAVGIGGALQNTGVKLILA